jgi:hypothetical protein
MRDFESLDGSVRGAREAAMEDVYGVWYKQHLADMTAREAARREAEGSAAARAAWLRRVVLETRRLVAETLPRAHSTPSPHPPHHPSSAPSASASAAPHADHTDGASGPALPASWRDGNPIIALHRSELDAMLRAWFEAGLAAGRAERAEE